MILRLVLSLVLYKTQENTALGMHFHGCTALDRFSGIRSMAAVTMATREKPRHRCGACDGLPWQGPRGCHRKPRGCHRPWRDHGTCRGCVCIAVPMASAMGTLTTCHDRSPTACHVNVMANHGKPHGKPGQTHGNPCQNPMSTASFSKQRGIHKAKTMALEISCQALPYTHLLALALSSLPKNKTASKFVGGGGVCVVLRGIQGTVMSAQGALARVMTS